MIITLTEADVKSIVEFYAEQGVRLAPALMERMSDEQLTMAAQIMRAAGERHMAHADQLERFAELSPEEKEAVVALAEAGCTAHEIASITGQRSLKQIEGYTKAADQRRGA